MRIVGQLRSCNGGSCPTVHVTDRGTYVVQGWVLKDQEALASLDLPEGETAVEVPRELIDGLGGD